MAIGSKKNRPKTKARKIINAGCTPRKGFPAVLTKRQLDALNKRTQVRTGVAKFYRKDEFGITTFTQAGLNHILGIK